MEEYQDYTNGYDISDGEIPRPEECFLKHAAIGELILHQLTIYEPT